MQTCPHCHTPCLDENNYCPKCQTKLPNTKEWMPDFQIIRKPSDFNPDNIMKLLEGCLSHEIFKDQLISELIIKSVEGLESGDEKMKYMGEETLTIMIDAALRYSGCGKIKRLENRMK